MQQKCATQQKFNSITKAWDRKYQTPLFYFDKQKHDPQIQVAVPLQALQFQFLCPLSSSHVVNKHFLPGLMCFKPIYTNTYFSFNWNTIWQRQSGFHIFKNKWL